MVKIKKNKKFITKIKKRPMRLRKNGDYIYIGNKRINIKDYIGNNNKIEIHNYEKPIRKKRVRNITQAKKQTTTDLTGPFLSMLTQKVANLETDQKKETKNKDDMINDVKNVIKEEINKTLEEGRILRPQIIESYGEDNLRRMQEHPDLSTIEQKYSTLELPEPMDRKEMEQRIDRVSEQIRENIRRSELESISEEQEKEYIEIKKNVGNEIKRRGRIMELEQTKPKIKRPRSSEYLSKSSLSTTRAETKKSEDKINIYKKNLNLLKRVSEQEQKIKSSIDLYKQDIKDANIKLENIKSLKNKREEKLRPGSNLDNQTKRNYISEIRTKYEPEIRDLNMKIDNYKQRIKESEKVLKTKDAESSMILQDINKSVPIATIDLTTEEETKGLGNGDKLMGLYDFQINNIVSILDIPNYLGTFTRDEINNIIDIIKNNDLKNFSFIINTAKRNSNKNSTKHWIAVYIDITEEMTFEIYNTLPQLGKTLINELLKKFKKLFEELGVETYVKLKINNVKLQSINSDSCGWMCIIYLLGKKNGLDWKELTYKHIYENENDRKKLEETFDEYGYI